jgi:two-component system catabolic regulation response regulator CreB/two-component system response regulator ChvI
MNKRVLLVDDEPDLNLTIKMILEENGFKVDSFTDPLSALENFRGEAGSHDLVILDIKMPNMNGFELYRQIKKIDDKAKVCFLTAGEMDYEQFRKELIPALDNNCYIQKPIETEMLIRRLNRILQNNDNNNSMETEREIIANVASERLYLRLC